MSAPECTIVAGPNGAGKTTFAMKYFADESRKCRFINADLIATGLSALSPESVQREAGRVFIQQVDEAILRKESFAFETTLAGRAHLERISKMRQTGWFVQ